MSGTAAATIVVTPRDRYSAAVRSLASVIEHTAAPHRLVYVSGGDPPHVLGPLRDMCRRQGYELIERPEYLGSNAARNLGLARVSTEYVVFLENDVLVEPGWLESLVTCADETGAAIVGPLTLFGEPERGFCHTLGGDFTYHEDGDALTLAENHRLSSVDLAAKLVALRRSRCDFVEFHCLLARRRLFDRIGPLDEAIISAVENIDLCLHARRLGESVYVEPASMVSILGSQPFLLGETEFWALRWSEEWYASTLQRFAEKWRLPADSSFLQDYWSHFHRYRETGRLPRAEVRPATRYPFAGTIDELAGQMTTAGYPSAAVDDARMAYAVAECLIAGVPCAAGVSQLAHGLGTGSVLAAYGAPHAVVAAGVLHAAYACGRFPDVVQGLAGARRWLRREVGGPIEAQVWDHHELDLASARAALADGVYHLPLVRAYSILIRLARAVDERRHHGLGPAPQPSEAMARSRARNEAWAETFSVVADALRCQPMLDLLLAPHDDGSSEPAPPPVRRPLEKAWRAPLGRRHRAYSPSSLVTSHGAVAAQGKAVAPAEPFLDLITGPDQWSFAATLALGADDVPGGAYVLSVELMVSEGRLGVGVLWVDRSDRYVVPELSVDASAGRLELRFALPEIREAGHLVFRSWTPGPTMARILSVSLHEA
jgi:GT2 family glycosyltransferase